MRRIHICLVHVHTTHSKMEQSEIRSETTNLFMIGEARAPFEALFTDIASILVLFLVQFGMLLQVASSLKPLGAIGACPFRFGMTLDMHANRMRA